MNTTTTNPNEGPHRPWWLVYPAIVAGAALLGFGGSWLLSTFGSVLGLDSVAGTWYMTRSAGLIAYLLIWLSTVWGLGVAGKIFDPVLHRAFTFDMHEFLSLLAIGFIVLHVVSLLFDQYLPFSIPQILLPFLSTYRPFWIGIGVIGMYLTLLVTVTFYLRSKIGQKTFRTIHIASFGAYVAVTLHSVFSGTDSVLWSAKTIYLASALVVVFFTVYWYGSTHLKQPTPQKAPVRR